MTSEPEQTQPLPPTELVGVPAFYVDAFGLQATSYTMRFNFAVQTSPTERVPVCQLLMSPQHAKVMAMVLTRALKEYEEQIGAPIHIPPRLMAEKKLAPENW